MLEKVQPSVVTILTGIEAPRRQRISRDEALYRLYFGIPLPEPARGEEWQQLGIGSGVIVTANGYILTNKHVIFPPDLRIDGQQYLDALRLRVSIPGRDGHLPARLIDFSQDMFPCSVASAQWCLRPDRCKSSQDESDSKCRSGRSPSASSGTTASHR